MGADVPVREGGAVYVPVSGSPPTSPLLRCCGVDGADECDFFGGREPEACPINKRSGGGGSSSSSNPNSKPGPDQMVVGCLDGATQPGALDGSDITINGGFMCVTLPLLAIRRALLGDDSGVSF